MKIIIPYASSCKDPLAVPQVSKLVIPISFRARANTDAHIPNTTEYM